MTFIASKSWQRRIHETVGAQCSASLRTAPPTFGCDASVALVTSLREALRTTEARRQSHPAREKTLGLRPKPLFPLRKRLRRSRKLAASIKLKTAEFNPKIIKKVDLTIGGQKGNEQAAGTLSEGVSIMLQVEDKIK
ncbi:MAG: hypothetical protein AAFP77_12245 [Bacteroidota bacterium]